VSKLQLILLGHFDCLLSSGERISLSMRKAEVLLAYLALAPGIRHPRDRLLNLLWSDRSEEQARNSLRQCLSTIKKSLGEAADLLLQVDRTTVRLIPDLVDVDALEFERLASDAGREALSNAAALYAGEFLEGISIRDAACQDWLETERSRFKRQYIEILTNLGHTLLASRDPGQAIRIAEQLVAEDTLGESGWRLLMRAYSENGDRSHSLQAFKRCRQALRVELDVEPEASTLELRDQISASQAKPAPMPLRDNLEQEVAAAPPPASTDAQAPVDESRGSCHRIAVLPFDNLSGDPEQEYFSDGITDSVILNLSMFPDLQVKSRNSSFAFKQQIKSPGEISRELNVDYMVEGSIRKSQDRIRITVQLIEATNGNQIWGKRYDAELENLFDLEEDLSRTIAATVTGQIESNLQRIALAKGAAGQHSYDLLLAGTYHSYRFNRKDTVIAIEKLNQCLQQDPDNIRAHVLLYTCHGMDYLERWTRDYQASFELAGTHARRALELGPELSGVQSAYAEYLIFSEKFEQASQHLDKALKINPNDPNALSTRALSLIMQEDFAAALKTAEYTCQLDPYHPWAEWELAGAQYLSGLYETALQTIGNFRTDPGFTQVFAIACLVKLDKTDSARQALQVLLRNCREDMLSMPQNIDEWMHYIRSCYPFTNPHISQDLIDCLALAGLDEAVDKPSDTDSKHWHSIAVLPFDNLSGDRGQEYFSDGISESIILHLNLFPGLNVKSRNSSFAFKQKIKSIGEISGELGVDYLVEGSLRKSAEQIRITVQLVEAASGNQVWGKRYDAPLADLFNLEEELSRSIAATVTGQIESDLQRIALTRSAVDPQAYDLLLAGIYHLQQYNRENNVIAVEKLNRCLAKDPHNLRAYVFLYTCHLMDYLGRWTKDYLASFELAAEHIRRVMALSPESNQAQVFFAQYLVFCGKFAEADRHLGKAFKTNPNDPTTLTTMALNLEMQGKGEEALQFAERACLLDPYHPWAEWEVAVSQYISGQYESTVQTIADMRTSPGFIQIFDIAAKVKLGRSDAARQVLQALLKECRESMLSMPQGLNEWLRYTQENYPFANPEINRDLVDCLLQAGLVDTLDNRSAAGGKHWHNIAVLPFDNLSGDQEQEYFSDGITDSIILNLSMFPDLQVKSRHSSFAFKQQLKSIGEISRELNVNYVVEGSIRKSRDRVRITVQLSETATGNQIWGKRYDAEIENLFELEEELSRSIAATVTGQIESDLQRIAVARGAADQQAYDLLLAGIYHLNRSHREDIVIAIDKLEQCLQQDPHNVRAHTTLYQCHVMNWMDRLVADYQSSFELAGYHARKAFALDPELGEAQYTHGEYLMFCRDYEAAAVHIEMALATNPNNPDYLTSKAMLLSMRGEFEAAINLAEQAYQLDPHNWWVDWNLAEAQYLSHRYQDAVDTIARSRNAPGFIRIYSTVANVKLDHMDAARQSLQAYLGDCRESMRAMPQTLEGWLQYTVDTAPFSDPGINQDIVDCLVLAGLTDESNSSLAVKDGDEQPALLPDNPPSIAVLPFDNMSGDADQDYFSDGITADIIATLSKFKHLRIVARHSTEIYRKRKVPIAEIAQQQQVRYILEGSVRRSGKRIRVSAELIDSLTEQNCWSERYDRDLDDLFAVQDEITQKITLAMKVHLDDGDMASQRSAGTSNIKAWELTMTAVDLQDTYIRQNILEARAMVKQALVLDPDYVFAWVALAWTHWQEVYSGWSKSYEKSLAAAEKASQHALAIDPDNADALGQAGTGYLMRHEADKALEYARRSVELQPGNAENQALLAFALVFVGDYAQARLHFQNVHKLCPVMPNWYYLIDAQIEQYDGNLERAIEIYQQGLAVEPDAPLCRFYLVNALMQKGDTAGAQQYADEIRAVDSSVNGSGLVRALSRDAGLRDEFHANLKQFGLA